MSQFFEVKLYYWNDGVWEAVDRLKRLESEEDAELFANTYLDRINPESFDSGRYKLSIMENEFCGYSEYDHDFEEHEVSSIGFRVTKKIIRGEELVGGIADLFFSHQSGVLKF